MPRRDDELDAEIAAHLRMAEQDRMARGETPAQARLGALREFGNEGLIKEVTREMWGWTTLRGLGGDFRYAARTLRRNAGFAAVVILTLALGIGANTAIFSTMRAALRPDFVPAAERVVVVWSENPKRDEQEFPVSLPDFRDWHASGIFSSLAAFDSDGHNLRVGDRTGRVDGLSVTGDFFTALAIPAKYGRLIGPEDAEAGSPPVAVLGNTLWRTRFAADPSLVGSTVVVDGTPHTVIGVLPAHYPFGDKAVISPLLPGGPTENDRGTRHYSAFGRLAPGLSLAAAQRRMDTLSAQLSTQYSDTDGGETARLQPLLEASSEDARYIGAVLFGAVGFVLLIACANIASLFLARGAGRAREMTVRAALGAGRWTLTRQLLAESLLLSFLGGAVALIPAGLIMKLIVSASIDQLPNPELIALDWRVLAFNLLLAAGTGILFGLAPAWQLRKLRIHDSLKAAGRITAGGSQQRLRSVLVACEVALTLVLLAGAGLMLRTFVQLRGAYPGYDTRGVLTMKIALSARQYPEGEKQPAFFAKVLREAAGRPGIESIGAIDDLPTSDNLHGTALFFPDRPDPRHEDVPIVLRNRVMGDYFRAMRIPLLRGRYFTDGDGKDAPLVAVVDEWTARRYWPNEDAIGKPIKFGHKEPVRHVVGVVGDVAPGVVVSVLKGHTGQLYTPAAQEPRALMTLVARTAGDPMRLAPGLRGVVRHVDIDQPMYDVRTLDDARAASTHMQGLISILLGGFAAVALLLAAIGIYGVMAYNVGQRTREFGIRMSLGAQPADVLRLALGRGALLAAIGIALGLAGAFGLTRMMQDLLFGIRATDPVTFAAVTVVLGVVTLAAGYVPARRATKVDPAMTLREE